ncbi:MAG: hypothetical protein ACO3XZ_05825, partial [Ilumatobacteraceae bacterium]
MNMSLTNQNNLLNKVIRITGSVEVNGESVASLLNVKTSQEETVGIATAASETAVAASIASNNTLSRVKFAPTFLSESLIEYENAPYMFLVVHPQDEYTSDLVTCTLYANSGPDQFFLKAYSYVIYWEPTLVKLNKVSAGSMYAPWDGVSITYKYGNNGLVVPQPSAQYWNFAESKYSTLSPMVKGLTNDQYYNLPSIRCACTQSPSTSDWNAPTAHTYQFNKGKAIQIATFEFETIGTWTGNRTCIPFMFCNDFINQGTQNYSNQMKFRTTNDGFTWGYGTYPNSYQEASHILSIDNTFNTSTNNFTARFKKQKTKLTPSQINTQDISISGTVSIPSFPDVRETLMAHATDLQNLIDNASTGVTTQQVTDLIAQNATTPQQVSNSILAATSPISQQLGTLQLFTQGIAQNATTLQQVTDLIAQNATTPQQVIDLIAQKAPLSISALHSKSNPLSDIILGVAGVPSRVAFVSLRKNPLVYEYFYPGLAIGDKITVSGITTSFGSLTPDKLNGTFLVDEIINDPPQYDTFGFIVNVDASVDSSQYNQPYDILPNALAEYGPPVINQEGLVQYKQALDLIAQNATTTQQVTELIASAVTPLNSALTSLNTNLVELNVDVQTWNAELTTYLPKSGGNVTGNLTVDGTISAGRLTVPAVLSAIGTELQVLNALVTPNGNVDTRLAALESTDGTHNMRLTALESGDFLPLNGGQITGNLDVTGDLDINGALTTSNGNVDTRLAALETTASSLTTTNNTQDTRLSALEIASLNATPVLLNIETTNAVTFTNASRVMFANSGVFSFAVNHDTSSMYNAGAITIQTAGYYMMFIHLLIQGTSGTPLLTTTVFKNGTTQIYNRPGVRVNTGSGTRLDRTYVTTFPLVSGDTISITFTETANVQTTIGVGTTII